jgi:hypothetical protein
MSSTPAPRARSAGAALPAIVVLCLAVARPARADEPAPAPTSTAAPASPPSALPPPTVAPPAPPVAAPPAAAPSSAPAQAPANVAPPPDVIVFHAPRAGDMETFASGSVHQMAIGNAHARLSANVFGDVDFSYGSQANTHPAFAIGTMSFLITGDLEKHFTSTAEIALEYDDTGTLGFDLERFLVGWHDEHFFVTAGRVHTAFGYWNNAYHHGKWLQPTIARPRWVEFEDSGGLLPIHTVGLSGGFSADLGRFTKLRTTVSVSNGRGHIQDDLRNTFDYQDSKAVHGQVEFIGVGLPDLRIGVASMYDQIPPTTAGIRPAYPGSIDEVIVNAHVAYPGYPLLVIIEGYGVSHRIPGHTFWTYGGFATLGYAIGMVTPYVRGQWITTHGGTDPFFVPGGDANAPDAAKFGELEGIAGLRVDLTDWTAVRGEYSATQLAHDRVVHQGTLQWCWGF